MKATTGTSQAARVSGLEAIAHLRHSFPLLFFFETAYSYMTASKWSSAAMRSQWLLGGLQKQKRQKRKAVMLLPSEVGEE